MSASGHAERRQLTVLFCDAVGSKEMAAELGPEAWLAVLRRFQQNVQHSA